jgi:hypothetical protein
VEHFGHLDSSSFLRNASHARKFSRFSHPHGLWNSGLACAHLKKPHLNARVAMVADKIGIMRGLVTLDDLWSKWTGNGSIR